MQTATLDLSPSRAFSKIDRTNYSRELWRAAYAMARRMIRDRRTAAGAWSWYLDHARRRFGACGWRIAQAAGRVVFDRRTVMYARAGSVADLERQGLVRPTRRPRSGNLTGTVAYRCAAFERLRGHGFSMAWSFDPLASGANAGLRASRAERLRGERAAILAEVESDERLYVLTDLGRAALVAAGMAADRVALAAGGSFATV